MKELMEIKSFPSVYGGKILFNPDHTCSKRTGLFRIVNGKKTFQKFLEAK
jgi:hypothetical protein